MRRLCALLLMVSLLCGLFPTAYAAESEQADWKLEAQSIELFKELHSVTPEIAYDGTVSYISHDDYPAEGFVFAVATLNVDKLNSSAEALDVTDLTLHAEGKAYAQMADDSFLENHGYTTLGRYNGRLITDAQGTVCFEVPESLFSSECIGWYLTAGAYTSEGFTPDESTEIPVEPDLIERQESTEAAILAQFESQSDKSLENALVVVNPYETAPLTALILFDTEEAVTVSVKVYGKTAETDISYTLDEKNTHHEIPIFGLYGGWENQVLVETSGGERKEFKIQTAPLPDDLPQYTAEVTEESSFDNQGLIYVLGTPHRYCIDIQGDIRWYSTISESAAVPEETNDDGSYWTSLYSASLGAHIVKVNWIGKILRSYAYPNVFGHHDMDIIEDDALLYFSGNNILKIDLQTGEQSVYLRLGDILNPNIGYIDNRNDPSDWAHANTIEYTDGKLLLSLRNQSMLIKMDYMSKQIEWVATPGLSYDIHGNVTGALQEGISDYIVLPKTDDPEFEWFWSQHDISIMPDQDNNPATDDFTLFDNGVYRGNPATSKVDMYSRIVQYRVNTTERTIEQIHTYGENCKELFSSEMSGTQAIPNGQLGCFNHDTASGHDTKLVEVNWEKNQAVASWTATGVQSYRAYYYDVQKFVPSNIELSEGNAAFEYYQPTSWKTWTGTWPTSQGLQYDIATLSVGEDGILDITGWAVIDGYSGNFAIPYFVVNGANTGIKYASLQHSYNALSIPSDLINPGDYSSGFWGVGVDLSLLPDDQYTVGLLVNANGTDQWRYVDLGYTYTKGATVDVPREDILEQQEENSAQILETYQQGAYTLQNPYVVVDPYGLSPLSAVALFSTSAPATISVEIEGKNGAAPVTHEFEAMSTQHQIPIYGLYAGEAARVTLTAHYADGSSETQALSLMGYSLPSDFVPVSVIPEDTDTTQMADGWTFLMAGSLYGYVYAIDEAGNVRWMLTEKGLGGASVFLPLENGNYLIGGDKSFGQYYKYNLFELDLTGRIVHEYLIDGYHHDAVELPSGNFLLCANNINGKVMEDTIYEIDRETGDILRTWDFNSYFDVGNYNEAGQHIADVNYGTGPSDWLHINGIDYNAATDSLLVSSRHQDAVFSMNLSTGEIDWILSDPNDLWPEYLQEKLLTPVGENFAWQYGQHNAIWLPNGDIMLFDNGDYRSKTPEGVVPATEAHSRAVIYHVDSEAKTVSQVWEFGSQFGPDQFAVNVSGVQYLGEDHYLIDFGGIVKNSAGEPTYNIMDGTTGSSRTEVYEVKDGEIVFHANVLRERLQGNTFRAVRLMPYASSQELDLSVKAERLGGLYSHGLATAINFDSADAVGGGPDVSVTDNGVQLLISAALENTASDLAIIFDSVEKDYRVALPGGSSISYTLNNSEISAGTYRLYLSMDGTCYDLLLTWTNTMTARPYPSGYDIQVAASSADKGAVYGSGTYYANTPFTVWVKPSDDAKFLGWYSNDTLLSTDMTYTLTAAQDMVLTAIFAGDTTGESVETAEIPFSDVEVSAWYHDAIVYIYQNGMMSGTSANTFSPNAVTTRGMIATILYHLEGEPATSASDFTDIATDSYYADAVAWAAESGIVNGVSESSFAPDKPINREQMAAVLYRYAQYKGYDTNSTGSLNSYADADQVSGWAQQAVIWANASGLISGNSATSLAPLGYVSRAEMATILMRFMENVAR